MKIRIALACIASFTSLSAYSYDDYSISSICHLQANENGNIYLQPCEGWSSKNSCSSGHWVTWDGSTEGGKAMYSTALTAFTTGKRVLVRMDGSSCNRYDVTSMIRLLKN